MRKEIITCDHVGCEESSRNGVKVRFDGNTGEKEIFWWKDLCPKHYEEIKSLFKE